MLYPKDIIQSARCIMMSHNYRILPNKGASIGYRDPKTMKHIGHKFLNYCPIFNLKPPLESPEPQLQSQEIRSDLASAPCALIR